MREKQIDLDQFQIEIKKLEENEEFSKGLELLENAYKAQSNSKLIKKMFINFLFNYGNHLNDEFIAKYKEAASIFKRIIKIDQENYRAYYNLGIALHNLNDLDNAIKMYEKAIKIKPDYKFTYYNIGLIYEDRLDFKRALEFHQKAVQIDPNFRYAKQAIKEVREILDNQSDDKEIEKLKSLLKMSNKVKIDLVNEILNMPKAVLLELLLSWGEKYDFRLDGEYLIINQDKLSELIKELENQGKY